MAFTSMAANAVLTSVTGKSATGIIPNCYMGLFYDVTLTTSGEINTYTEPTGNGYGRIVIGLASDTSTQVMSAPVNGATHNSEILFFPEATAAWTTTGHEITHFGLFNAQTGGDLMIWGALNNPVSVGANCVPLFREFVEGTSGFKMTMSTSNQVSQMV